MIVFKNYFNIVKRHIGIIILFTVIGIGVIALSVGSSNTKEYGDVKPKIGIINYDNSELSNSFTDYLSEVAKTFEVSDDSKEIQDTLYYNKADSIIIIPNNFENDLLGGSDPTIKIKKSAENVSKYTENIINRYFKIVENYSKVGMTKEEILDNIKDDVKKEITVEISNKNKSDMEILAVYYSFENYPFLSIFIFIIGTIMCIFNKDTIKKRNTVSSLETKKFTKELFLGHVVLTISIWLLFVIVSIILYKNLMFTMNGLLYAINSLCFAITATSLAYAIGCLIKNVNVISGVQNVVALGLSFISGSFVPPEILAPGILSFSKIFPSYWFVSSNYDIAKITVFTWDTILPIISKWGIILAFGVLYFIISRIITLKKTRI